VQDFKMKQAAQCLSLHFNNTSHLQDKEA